MSWKSAAGSVLFLVVGLGTLGGGGYAYVRTAEFIEEATPAEGKVIRLERRSGSGGKRSSTTYAPVVRFQTSTGEEVEFTSSVSSSSPGYSEGERVRVLYLRSDPSEAEIDEFLALWFVPLVAGVLGSMFVLVGSVSFASGPLSRWREEKIRREGTPILADVQEVVVGRVRNASGKNSFRIVAQWQDPVTAKIQVFRSKRLWADLPRRLAPGAKITVFVLPNDRGKYLVDVSSLPELDPGPR
jgi:hypothetical protein